MKSTLRRTWAEIDLDALAYNYSVLRVRAGDGSRFLGVVKADAYGHGAVEIARQLEALGAEYLAVSSVDEAAELRRAGIALPVLQLGLTPADQTPRLLADRVTQAVYSESAAKAFSAAAVALGGKVRVHVKLDTGMSRLGFRCDGAAFADSLEAVVRVCALPGLEVEGVFTHFAVSDEPGEDCRAYTQEQYARFQRMLTALEARGITFAIRHCANSGAAVGYPEYFCDMFRPGILTYGLGEQAGSLGLRPVMTLKTTVGVINTLDADTAVSYGCTYRTARPARVGVLPIGYGDGLRRALYNQWKVYVGGGYAPIIGRICMDMCMVDLTDLPDVREGDEVEIYGAHTPMDEAARLTDTISYELACAVSKRVPRIYFRRGREIARELLLRGEEG